MIIEKTHPRLVIKKSTGKKFELDSQLFIKDVGEIKCRDSKCIIVEIFFVIDTRQKLKNGKTTDQSLQEGSCDTLSLDDYDDGEICQ